MAKQMIDLDRETARRAICIDFEGRRHDPPSLLGVACEGEWSATIIEPALWPMAARGSRHGVVTTGDTLSVVRAVQQRAIDEDRLVMAWSIREIEAITAVVTDDEMAWWWRNLVNALQLARRWKVRNELHVTIESITVGKRVNRNPLASYMKAIGYEVPPMHGVGNTARRILFVREALERRGDAESLTPTAKAKWTNLLEHNRHDCLGLAAVMEQVARDRADA